MNEETDTLRDCLDGWDGKVYGDELAALASKEASDGGGSGASSLAMAESLKLVVLKGSMALDGGGRLASKKKPWMGWRRGVVYRLTVWR